MRTERASGYFTQLVVDRMAGLSGPATLGDIVEAVESGSHVPWNYVLQVYQARLEGMARQRQKQSNSPSIASRDDLGHYESFDATDVHQRRLALHYIVRTRLNTARRSPGAAWAVRCVDGRWMLNPDESRLPKVCLPDGSIATFDAETRAALDAGKAEQIAVVQRSSDRRTFDQMPPDEQGAALRFLTDRLPTTKGGGSRFGKSLLVEDWRRRITEPDQALAKLRELLCRE